MSGYQGDYTVGSTVVIGFETNDKSGGAVAPSDAFEAADVAIYKDGGATKRASASGLTMSSPFDSVVGQHQLTIDLSDDTDAGFYTAGSDYRVVMQPDETVDTETVVATIGDFSIENRSDIPKLDRNADLIESQRGFHTWHGNYFYVDPDNGNDANDGSRLSPRATIQSVHDDLVTDSNHDVIFLVAGNASGVTIHASATTTTISKRYTFIRGPGRDFIITRIGNGNTIEVTADGVELKGFQLGTAITGSGNGIDATDTDFLRVQDVWILDTQGDGINILRGSNCQLIHNNFEDSGQGGSGQGIHIVGTAGSSNDNRICDNHFARIAGDAILIEDGTTDDTEICRNTIHDCTGWGINIGASSASAQVYDNLLGNNASGNILDNGTISIIKNNREWLSATNATTQDNESNTYDVTLEGTGGVDWGNVENQTTDIFLTGTVTTGLVMQRTTIATLASQTSFTLSVGSSDDDAYNGAVIVFEDAATRTQKAFGLVLAYTGSTKTVTLAIDPGVFTMEANDVVTILATSTAPGILDTRNTAATHNVPTSVGRQIRQLSSNILGPFSVASATANTISLDADSDLSEVDGSYDPSRIFVDSGTGLDQTGTIIEYFGGAGNGNPARTIILKEDLKVTLDATSAIFIIVSDGRISTNQGQLRNASPSTTTATLNALSPGADVAGQTLHFTGGTGQDQVALIESYSDPVATFPAIDAAVDATTSYELLPIGCVNLEMIGNESQSAADLKDFADDGYDPVAHKITGIIDAGITELTDDIFAELVENGLTFKQAMRLLTTTEGGKLSGAATATITITNAVADDVDRVVATVDGDGNRTAITYDFGDSP